MKLNKPSDFLLDGEFVPRGAVTIYYSPDSHGAMGRPFSNSVPEPLVSIDSPLMTIHELQQLSAWIFNVFEWSKSLKMDQGKETKVN